MKTPRIEEMVSSVMDALGVVTDTDEETILQALTEAKQAGIDETVEKLEELRAEEERVQGWISKGGVDYIDNKARLDILNKAIKALQDNK
jgi:hypothetical protein